jgi:creatinine amidohydrolase/Fe(II)-dependent formamide hydrolase-like protein
MLLAVDADPGACGYTPEQVEDCLAALANRGVHQESPAAEHTGWMLAGKGLLPAEASGMGRLRERPEIMQLRFHALRSPVDAIPADLRAGAYRRLLDHASGAVQWSERRWLPYDPLSADALSRPYRAESSGRGRRSSGPRPPPAASRAPLTDVGDDAGQKARTDHSDFLLGEMSWPRARDRLKVSDTALLPVGAVEQHGPHLPLDTDAWDADYPCLEVAARCSEPRPLVLPLIPYGVSYHHEEFPGTLSVSPRSLSSLVYDIGMSVARHGVRKLVIVNGHGGNAPALQYAAQMINRDAHIFTCVDTGETSDFDIAKIAETADDVHAGEIETSTTLATRPGLVDMTSAVRNVPRYTTHYLRPSSTRSVPWYSYTGQISQSGVLGDPTRASREKGEQLWQVMIDRLVEFVEALKGRSLEELHERRL